MIRLTEHEKRRARWRARGYSQELLVREMLSARGATINIGPRGGRTYGSMNLSAASYRGLKNRIDDRWTCLRLLEDHGTNRVRVAPRDHPAFERMEQARATT